MKIVDVVERAESKNLDKVIILLHGYGADGRDLYGLTNYLDPEGKSHFMYPEGPVQVPIGPHMMGRAWFPLNMAEIEQAMATGTYRSYVDRYPEQFEQAVETVTEFLKPLTQKYSQITLGGFSQGGMIASHVAACSDIPIEKLVLMSTTLVNKKVLEESYTASAAKHPTFISHGYQDPVLSPQIAEEFYTFLSEKQSTVVKDFFQGGHEIPMGTLHSLKEFLSL